MKKKLSQYMKCFKYFKNPVSCILFLSKSQKECCVKFKDNYEDVYLENTESLRKILNCLESDLYTDDLKEYIENLILKIESFPPSMI